jgi:uncharacterized membrane protein YjjB (DUF3815 family)
MNWLTPLWAAPAALGFALLFNIRTKALPGVCALAVVGMAVRNVAMDQGMSPTLASLLAALLIGAVGYTAGPWTHEASPVYAFAPVIPMVPGSAIFKALGALVNWQVTPPGADQAGDVLVLLFTEALKAASITLALAVGTILPMLLLPWARRGLGAP